MSDSMDAAEYRALRQRGRSKYGNKRIKVDGIAFDSIAEARRWQDLRLMERAGAIRQLERQPRFPLVVNGLKIAEYVADFAYEDAASGFRVIEDVKGVRTRVYAIKRKLMRAVYNVEIQEIEANDGHR